jgi:hypothetical protein
MFQSKFLTFINLSKLNKIREIGNEISHNLFQVVFKEDVCPGDNLFCPLAYTYETKKFFEIQTPTSLVSST